MPPVAFSPLLLFKCLGSLHKGEVDDRGGENSAVPGLLLGSILIAASLKARRVPFTVLIPIWVIDFESGGDALSWSCSRASCHPLQQRSWSGPASLTPTGTEDATCPTDQRSATKCCLFEATQTRVTSPGVIHEKRIQ